MQTISNSVNSGSGDGTGQSGKGNLVLSTSTTLPDKRFLMMGNDAGSLAQHKITSTTEAPSSVLNSYRIDRKWKVYNTGSVGQVNLSFDTTGLGNQQGGNQLSSYMLMIDQNGDGDFTTGTLSFFTANSATGKKINFSGVTLNNGVVFTIITFRATALLPAVWLGFTAELVNGNGVLSWKTGDEINVDRYTIEHSFNATSFSAFGSIAANNQTGTNQYSFTDNALASGIHYYRIRRTDKDGKSEYSEIKSVKVAGGNANVVIRPNPVTSTTLAFSVTVQQNSRTIAQVMCMDGKILSSQNISLKAGSNMVNINIAVIPAGVYLVQLTLNDEVISRKFIKQP